MASESTATHDSNNSNENRATKLPLAPLPPSFDLESYINQYTGHTRIYRLISISHNYQELEEKALKLAEEEAKQSANVVVYKALFEESGNKLGTIDKAWLETREKRYEKLQEQIESDLNTHKMNLAKESIRKCYNDMGDLYYTKGDLPSALKCYARVRDYYSSQAHLLQMCFNVLKVSLELKNFFHISNYIAKAEQSAEQDVVSLSKIRVMSGINQLASKKYKLAARKFLEVSPELGNNYTEVVSQSDVAMYAAILALATFDRQELKTRVLEHAQFKLFLELVPEVRELLQDFHSSSYTSFLKHLDNIRPLLELDIHLSAHVSHLYEKIRAKALVQYFSPFISVDMNSMAAAFNTDVTALETELATLIFEGSISARIDSHNKILYARTLDQRSATFERALQNGEEYQRNAKALLLRMNVMKTDVFTSRSEDTNSKKSNH